MLRSKKLILRIVALVFLVLPLAPSLGIGNTQPLGELPWYKASFQNDVVRLSPLVQGAKAGQPTTVTAIYLPIVQKLASEAYDRRFGVVITNPSLLRGGALLNLLQVHAYYDYQWGTQLPGNELLQTVARSNISETGLDDYIRANPGMYWQIGNEPNVPNQDNLTAAQYAQKHYQWANRIKAIDPTAKILNGGIVNWPDVAGDEGAALAYIRDFRQSHYNSYGSYPTIDVWNIHAFPPFDSVDGRLISRCDTTLPKRFITDVFQYLRGVGDNKPIWLTEFGMDWVDDPDPCSVTFMADMVGWLRQTGKVERWFWFSDNAWHDGKGGALVDLSGNLTALGRKYRDLSAGQ